MKTNKKPQPRSAAARQQDMRARRAELGHKRREIYCNDEEYRQVKAYLKSLRDSI